MERKIYNKIEISNLLSQYLLGSIKKEDQEKLEIWLQEDAAHQRLLAELQSQEYKNSRESLINGIDLEKEWNRFQSNVASKTIPFRSKLLNLISYAAVILLPLLIASYLIFQDYTRVQSIAQMPIKIVSGMKKAQLVLSNGKRIVLADQNLQIEAVDKGVEIKNRNQSLSYMISGKSSDLKEQSLVYNRLLIGKGEEYHLILSDGTKVWLNSETILKYPTQFADNIREVELIGEACFKVSKNNKAPFIVKTKQLNVEVLGTFFNVSAYEDDEVVKATLIEGKVKVGKTILKPNDQAVYVKSTNEMNVRVVDADRYVSWTHDMFVFDEEPLEEIMRKLARWYDIKVFFQDKEVKKNQFSGKLPRFKDCNELFEMIEKTTKVKFTIYDRQNILISTK